MKPLRVFVGFDERETVAFHVCAESIRKHASYPVAITPLVRSQLPVFSRPRGPLESTDFAYTRFLVPWLVSYEELAIFMDCDMLVKTDILDLVRHCQTDPMRAVWVCQHDYQPKTGTKFLGQKQTSYPRKNWSSVMVFQGSRCKALTPAYVNEATGAELHRFAWLKDEQIGSLPLEWNWLVDEYPHNDNAKILHYTLGGPWFPETFKCDHAEDWLEVWRSSMCLSRAEVRA
jgi:hypothetical protein